jgi:hypothetical protein
MRIDASDQLDPAAGPRDSRRREDRDDESVAQR